MSFQPGSNLYTQGFGSKAENIEVPLISAVNPSTTDINYPVGKRWLNTVTEQEFILYGFSSFGGVMLAKWGSAAGASGAVDTLSNGIVKVTADITGNIALLGTSNQITVTSEPGSNALAFSLNDNLTVNNLTVTGNLEVDGDSTLHNTVMLGNDNQTVSINTSGTGNVAIGSGNGAQAVSIQAGTGAVNVLDKVNIGQTSQPVSINTIANGTVNIGSGASTQAINLTSGTGGVNIVGAPVDINTTVSNTTNVGSTSGTYLNLPSSGGANFNSGGHGINISTDVSANVSIGNISGSGKIFLIPGSSGGFIDLEGGILNNVAGNKTANYTATANDYFIPCDSTGSAFTISLPSPLPNSGQHYVIADVGGAAATHNITINGGTHTITGQGLTPATTQVINANYGTMELYYYTPSWQASFSPQSSEIIPGNLTVDGNLLVDGTSTLTDVVTCMTGMTVFGGLVDINNTEDNTTNIGNSSTTNSVNIASGSGGISVQTTGGTLSLNTSTAQNTNIGHTSGANIALLSSGAMNLNSSGFEINVGTDNANAVVEIGSTGSGSGFVLLNAPNNGYISLNSGILNDISSVKTSNYNANSSDYFIPCDSSGGILTITLPNGPNLGQTYVIADVSGSAATNNITINGASHNIVGPGLTPAATQLLNVNYGAFVVTNTGSTWQAVVVPVTISVISGNVEITGNLQVDGGTTLETGLTAFGGTVNLNASGSGATNIGNSSSGNVIINSSTGSEIDIGNVTSVVRLGQSAADVVIGDTGVININGAFISVGGSGNPVNINSTGPGGTTIIGISGGSGTTTVANTALDLAVQSVKTSTYAPLATDCFIPCDTSGGAFSITLPASPALGQFYIVADATGSASVNPITVNGNGHNIQGQGFSVATTQNIVNNYQTMKLVWSTTYWQVI